MGYTQEEGTCAKREKRGIYAYRRLLGQNRGKLVDRCICIHRQVAPNLSIDRGKNHLDPSLSSPEPWQNGTNSCQISTLSKEASFLRKIGRTIPNGSINKGTK